eukprot:6180190-Pyramimonas_sp.AAC.1
MAVRATEFEELVYADDLNAFRAVDSSVIDDQPHRMLVESQTSLPRWGEANRVVFDPGKDDTVTKKDLIQTEINMMKAMKTHVSEELTPMKRELVDLSERLCTVEQRSSSTSLSKRQVAMLNTFDPANKRIALI